MDHQAAREPRQRAADRKCEQPLPVDVDADGLSRRRVLARGAQLPARRASPEEDRDGRRDQRADGRLEEVRRLRHERERLRPRPDLLPEAQDVVGDLENGQRGDPGRQARQTHERDPDDSGEYAAEHRGEHERGDVPHVVLGEEGKQLRHQRRLDRGRDGRQPGREGADRNEADVPEREYAGVAHEHVERDHDRHRHERGYEVLLGPGRHEAAHHPDEHDQAPRHQELHGAVPVPARSRHTRSTAVLLGRANRPAGRSRRTRITSRKTKEGRKTRSSAGSASPSTDVRKPIAKPPRVAVPRRSIPPTTTPTSPRIVTSSPNVGVTSGRWTVRRIATAAASRPASTNAKLMTVSARTPRSRAARKSAAAARICSPIVVRPRRNAVPPSRRPPTASIVSVIQRTSRSPSKTRWLRLASTSAVRPSGPKAISHTPWSANATANVATSVVVGLAARSGRKATRSISRASAMQTTTVMVTLAILGKAAVSASV